ncbi:MAG: methyltransferase domain-containing protein [Pseudomonadota bacterium]
MQTTVQEYYGKTLQSSDDLATDACCTIDDVPAFLRPVLARIHPEVTSRYYGCGLIAPEHLKGLRVLDLGSGAGRDAFALSYLVGAEGSVVGVDMTPEQLEVARAHIDWHRDEFGYHQSNVDFLNGDIEALDEVGLAPSSFDLIVSNCVINLCEDKERVFRAAYGLLKPGGEFYFSDVYADRRLPEAARKDPKALGECLAGALYWNDFLTLAKQAGFKDPRLVTDRPLEIRDQGLRDMLSPALFYSATYRLFKAEGLEPACEDYGQAVIYKGGIPNAESVFVLDAHHRIEKDRVFPVCGNTLEILQQSRFASFFEVVGDGKTHYGIFPGCGTLNPLGQATSADGLSGCC